MFANAETKMRQTKNFFDAIVKNNKEYKKISEKWKIEIDQMPIKIEAYKTTPTTIIGNDKKPYKLSKMKRDFSHEFAGPLRGKKINSWAILYSQYGRREYDTFVQELQSTVQ